MEDFCLELKNRISLCKLDLEEKKKREKVKENSHKKIIKEQQQEQRMLEDSEKIDFYFNEMEKNIPPIGGNYTYEPLPGTEHFFLGHTYSIDIPKTTSLQDVLKSKEDETNKNDWIILG